MQGTQKSRRVSWASDGNLCQVKLFLSEECPSQVGIAAQDHLQAKKTLSGFPVNGLVVEDNLPPGFEGFNPANQLKNRLAQIPVIKWRPPPKFILNVEWEVKSGKESDQVKIQSQRELRLLEAYYPRQSAIPPNPAVAPDVECAVQDHRTVPSIPITPVEEEDLPGDISSNSAASISAAPSANPLLVHGVIPSSQGVSPNFNSGVLAAGMANCGQEDALKAALTAVAKSNEQIDHDLLVKILSNPTLLEQLVGHQGPNIGSQYMLPKPLESSPQTILKPLSPGAPVYKMDPPPLFNNAEAGSASSAMMSNGLLYPYPNGSGSMSMTHQQSVPSLPGVVPQGPPVQSASASHVKDLNYYKNLIQQHGGERRTESIPPFVTHPIHHPGVDQDIVDNLKIRDAKHKIMKPCMFFNTSKGCRHGASCIYQHDMSSHQRVNSIPEMQGAKRMKMDREIRGTQPYS